MFTAATGILPVPPAPDTEVIAAPGERRAREIANYGWVVRDAGRWLLKLTAKASSQQPHGPIRDHLSIVSLCKWENDDEHEAISIYTIRA
jgi:hypothetical protein